MCNSIGIVTDSNSGITSKEANEWGVTVIPMPFYINGELYYEGLTLNQKEFYKFLEDNLDVNTSQPSPGDVMKNWDEVLKEKEYIIYIPMSSSLSGTYETAVMLAEEYEGKVFVVNNRRISVTQLQSVKDAINLVKKGKSAKEIKEILEDRQYQASIYIVPDTLDYLKKGGRLTPAVASFAKVLNINPVLQIQGEKLDAFKKVRGRKQAKRAMKEAIADDIKDRFASNSNMRIYAAYTGSEEVGIEWKGELEEAFPNYDIQIYPLSLSVSCHIGPGAIGIACVEELLYKNIIIKRYF